MLKSHPCNRFGWLYVPGPVAAAAMNTQLTMVAQEKLADPNFSGEPPRLFPWALHQLRPHARDPRIAEQITKRREMLQLQLAKVAEDRQRKLDHLDRQVEAISGDLAILDQLEAG